MTNVKPINQVALLPSWITMPTRKGRGYQAITGGYFPQMGLYPNWFSFLFYFIFHFTYIILSKGMSYVLL